MKRRGFIQSATAALLLGGTSRIVRAADEGQHIKRVVFWYLPNGTDQSLWQPSGVGASYQLSPLLEPLTRHRERMMVLSNIRYNTTEHGPGDGHEKGNGQALTAMPLVQNGGRLIAGGPSIDQVLAAELGHQTPYGSLELGVRSGDVAGDINYRVNFDSNGNGVIAQADPLQAVARLFSGVSEVPADNPTGDTTEFSHRRTTRQRVLTQVMDDYRRHTDAIASEFRVDVGAQQSLVERFAARFSDNPSGDGSEGSLAECRTPIIGDIPINSWDDHSNIDLVAQAQMDVATAALACDLTRVLTLQFTRGGSHARYTHLGIHQSHHDLAHGFETRTTEMSAITRFHIEKLAEFMDKLQSIQDGDGTLLDHTMIYFFTELGHTNFHTHDNIPTMILGGSGDFRYGEHIVLPEDTSHIGVLRTLAQQFGSRMSGFGMPEHDPGILSSLLS